MYREMEGSSWRRLAFIALISLHFVLVVSPGFVEDKQHANYLRIGYRIATIALEMRLSGDSKNTNKAESHTSSSRTGTKVILVLLGFVAVAMFSFFLYKLWQKKKRDEQYARLLKLFEEDDELEVELGLRD
ncbi:BnaCnng19780D [Brassica napus]|uniref:BnaCnng19780D protein n=2 Tax=Brassica TaxID=3705 RepID=A0A078ILL1_BRANA|nr:BnaCnng19780D [Brassica napus]VDD41974.1 unnamed protein product [Brassica oleracea]